MKFSFTYQYKAHRMQFSPLSKKGPPYERLLIEADTIEDAAAEAKRQYPEHVKATDNPHVQLDGDDVDVIIMMPRPDNGEAETESDFFDFMTRYRPKVFDFGTLEAR